MSFDPSALLKKATSRAKSDVANKLVSMLLHEISRRVCKSSSFSVAHPEYLDLAWRHFKASCPYCMRALEEGRSVVEHLDGMNRFRAGLHVPGNVLISCSTCNREKRRDDQLKTLVLADSGWESFLFHDGTRCPSGCKSCNYWKIILPDKVSRATQLEQARRRIKAFQSIDRIASLTELARPLQSAALRLLPVFYTQGQEHAHQEIHRMCHEIELAVGL